MHLKMSTKETDELLSGSDSDAVHYKSEKPQLVVGDHQWKHGQRRKPGEPVAVMIAPELTNPPPDNLIYSIFVAIFCCWPLGIFAVAKALATRYAIIRGDRAEAQSMSRSSRRFAHCTLACGVIVVILWFVVMFVIYQRTLAMITAAQSQLGDTVSMPQGAGHQ